MWYTLIVHTSYNYVCMKFHKAVIIYNPNSTGDSEKNAKAFARELKSANNTINIEIVATKYAGHAEEIAEEYSDDTGVVLVSSSGDGGYNEVVNGALSGKANCAVAVLPSGNANDHHRAAGSDDLAEGISNGTTRRIEAIKITSTVDGKSWERYAHSYVGFGLTPKVGKVLTDVRPNVVTEKWYVLKHAFSFKHVKIESDGKSNKYHSLIAATIDRMSKVIKLDETADMNDGKMEIYESKYLSPFKTLKELLSLGVSGVSRSSRVEKLELKTTKKPTLVQLDGEVFTIDSNSTIKLICVKDCLRTIA